MNLAVTAGTVVALGTIALIVVVALRLESPWLQPWALLRAAVQLGLLSIVLMGIISEPLWVAAFLLIMAAAATWVVVRRLQLRWYHLLPVLITTAVSVAVPAIIVFATGSIELSPRYVLAVGGILIGNAMSAATLMGRSLSVVLIAQRDEIEAWFALGARPRFAASRAVRSAASTALIPSTDQTRTTGIVTLPGAFVGAVFAGASPLEAAQFQLVVLGGVLAVAALTVAGYTWIFGAPVHLTSSTAEVSQPS